MLILKMSPEAIQKEADNWEQSRVAIQNNNNQEARRLINLVSQQELGNVDQYGYTALHWAIDKKMKEVAEILIPKMSSEAINAATEDGWTALTWAASKGM